MSARPPRVLVAYDGSPNAKAALRRGAEEARRRGARLDVVHVIGAGAPRPVRAVVAWLRLRNAIARTVPRADRVGTRPRVTGGTPRAALPRLARQAELLVIGARDRGGPGDPLLAGETVPAVLAMSPCRVLVCADQRTERAVAAAG